MNNSAPGYLTPFIVSGTLAIVAAALFGLRKALARWPDRERRRAFAIGASLILLWLVAALLPSWLGFYGRGSARIPTIQYGILLPILAGVAFFLLSRSVRRVVDALPQEWLVGVQLYRTEGLIFLVLYAKGHLPGAFAWPAGVGDILVGLLAPVVAFAYARKTRHALSWVRTWNLLGIADLIVAVTAGFLTSPSQFQIFALDRPNLLIGAFPLAMIPVFVVPLSILLHLASLHRLASFQKRKAPADGTAIRCSQAGEVERPRSAI